MIVTAARGVAQSSIAVITLGEPLTANRAGSMALILGGSALYGWAKDRYAQSKKDQTYLPVSQDAQLETLNKESR
jgi:GDP-fucose transporter C1